MDLGLKMRFNDRGAQHHIRPLNDTKAVEVGADFMSEALLFTIAALTIVAETWRSTRNSRNRTNALNESVDTLETVTGKNHLTIAELKEQVEDLREELAAFKQEFQARQESLPIAINETNGSVLALSAYPIDSNTKDACINHQDHDSTQSNKLIA
ncbi:hypothetical protein, variant 3 [Batrachochytrium dendrobatidis JEL423]|nr:Optic atrophy 3 protein [Batrachochytrium dendrobatidis]OAJ44075.1 hypothetical protein, variant 1 [Batrachochytrium dendrobatidis JEL423]OAJ44076.1 hypothetical protein, variant 2 [Batrachochytrium dendrobatidis JEL423]OAJ44077.1 hypothetical protein, variant 3 [Batrachochytrium dendrobatidis JEL423]